MSVLGGTSGEEGNKQIRPSVRCASEVSSHSHSFLSMIVFNTILIASNVMTPVNTNVFMKRERHEKK